MRSRKLPLLCLATLLLAAVAYAATVAGLTADATALDAVYSSITDRATNCPNGNCTGRTQIEADFAAAESDRSALAADRQTLEPCSNCGPLDNLISTIDGKATALTSVLEGWEEQG